MVSDESLLLLLKTEGPLAVAPLAERLGVTPQGLRRRLEALRREGYLTATESRDEGGGAGRPSQRWRLTAAGHARFPDAHDQVAVGLIESIRERLGEAALESIVAAREAEQRQRYRSLLAPLGGLGERLQALARQRSAEGYMAEVRETDDGGGYLLIEHHCPICAAARACQGFCRSELAIFRAALGPEVTVERTQHLLAGGQRCVYRVAQKKGAARPGRTRGPAARRKAATV